MEKYKSINVATNWWTEKITTPTAFNNGDNSRAGDMATMLALMLASQNRSNLSDKQVEDFKQLLGNAIEKQLDTRGYCSLEVDYEPEGILYEVAAETEIDSSLFPWKTTMKITKNEVKVSEGYGSEYQVIYPVKYKVKQ